MNTRKPQPAANSPKNLVSKQLAHSGRLARSANKLVVAYALEGPLDVSSVRSKEIAIEWPPRTGCIIHVGGPPSFFADQWNEVKIRNIFAAIFAFRNTGDPNQLLAS